MRRLVLILIPLLAALPALARTGAIRGSVYDADYRSPIAEARISIVGSTVATRTNENGTFLIEGVPAGSYILSIARAGYERKIERDVVVTVGGMTSVNVELVLEVYEMEPVIVTGEDFLADSELGLIDIRQEAVNVQDSISQETFSKAATSDVAGALTKVVGASVTDGKYATVRGLSDRYTGTTLHGTRIPSADPRRRAVQLDLFPTGTVESVTVRKTFTPDLLGDFTGGGVDIVTRSVPEELVLSFSAGVEYDSEATGNDAFLAYNGGGVSLLDDGGRGLDSRAAGRFPSIPSFFNPDEAAIAAAEELDLLTNAFSPVMGVSPNEPGVNRKAQFVVGNRYALGQAQLGLLAAITQSRKSSSYENAVNDRGTVGGIDQGIGLIERSDTRGKEELLSGMIVNATLIPNDRDEISLRWVGNYAAEDVGRLQVETNGDSLEQNQSLYFTEREVTSAILQGKHRFPNTAGRLWREMEFYWTVSDNTTRQNEPDVRFFRNSFDLATLSFSIPSNSTDAQNTRRTFREIDEDDVQIAANLEMPFNTGWAPEGGKLKFGLYDQRTERAYTQNSFTYTFPQQVGSFSNGALICNFFAITYIAESPDELWTDVFTDPDRIGLAPRVPECEFNMGGQETPSINQLLWTLVPTGNDVNYDGEQTIQAAYAMAEMPLSGKLDAIFGARYETTELSIRPFNALFGTVELIDFLESGARQLVKVDQQLGNAEIDEGALLPSVGLIYELPRGMKLRANWSETFARPTFRELAPVATEEFIQGDEFVGNPELRLSEITNYDLRWEWFRKRGELFAVSVFYKELTDPIEFISFSTNNRSFIQPVNFEEGELFGTEFEARVDLGNYFNAAEGLVVGANYTVLDSESTVPEAEQRSLEAFGLDEPTRRLQGQPDTLANAFVTYDHEKSGTSFGIFYNRTGETLLTGAARGVEDGNPNVFEAARSNVDVTFKKRLGDYLTLSLGGKNLTGTEDVELYRIPTGDEAIRTRRDRSRRFSLSLGVKW